MHHLTDGPGSTPPPVGLIPPPACLGLAHRHLIKG